MRFLSLFFMLFLTGQWGAAQYTLSGKVANQAGEKLDFTTIYLEGTEYAAASGENGLYEITNLPSGEFNLKAFYIGYRPYEQKITITGHTVVNIILAGEIYNLDQIEIHANRVGTAGPYAKTNLDRQSLLKMNSGQDVPFLLQWTPSLLVTSDAGTGIGYTGMRIRGSDQTRINVTVNGVPINDAESHNVFWVDLPDLTGSVNNIQIQRGAGPSTSGPGAFGGTVSISTSDTRVNPFLDLSLTAGSFNTKKLSVKAGSGLINNRYFIEGRYSLIRSDGFIDRASADLNSLYFSAARVSARSSTRFNILSGREVTYQSWYGVPEARVTGNTADLISHYYNNLGTIYKSSADSVNLFSSDRRYNYYTYPNQVDNYRQTHCQLLHSMVLNKDTKVKFTAFYTKGKGYYEEFRYQDDPAAYLIPPYTDSSGQEIISSDLTRRRWLDNDLVGLSTDFAWAGTGILKIDGGITAMNYLGNHFGHVIKMEKVPPVFDKERKYYYSESDKKDFSGYLRALWPVNKNIDVTLDIQGRMVDYNSSGTDNDQKNIDINYRNSFLNPKFGISYHPSRFVHLFGSYSLAHKEPLRSDFIDNQTIVRPLAEKLRNLELGFLWAGRKWAFEANFYNMRYRDQLVLTGDINDVGAPLRINVPESYRIGLETSLKFKAGSKLELQAQTTLSQNKIKEFTEVVLNYTNGFEKEYIKHTDTDISFSPAVTAYLVALFKPVSWLEVEVSSRYAGRQFLDNTSDIKRSLSPYHYQNIRISGSITSRYWNSCRLSLHGYNVLDNQYASNGYTYTYIYGSRITENFLYPQAGRNFMVTLDLGF